MSFALSCALALCPVDVLTLEDGSKLIGTLVSPENPAADGMLQVLSAAGRVCVPEHRVRQREDRAQLLPAYRELRASGEALHCQLGRALWCLDHGLWEESLDELDQAMLQAPESAAWRSVLDRAQARVSLEGTIPEELSRPSQVLDLIALARGKQPARAAVARHWLATAPNEVVRTALEDAADSARIEVRRECLRALVARADEASLSTLILRSLQEKDPALRTMAGDAVKASKHPDLFVPYLHALRSSRSDIRERALPMLEELQDPRAIGPMIAMMSAPRQSGGGTQVPRNHIFIGQQISTITDFEVEIAQGAVIADPVVSVLQEGSLLDVRATSAPPGPVMPGRARWGAALQRLSGRRFGADPVAWREWWAKEGDEILKQYQESQQEARQQELAAAQAKQMQ